MTLLKAVVFLDVMQVIPPDDDCSLHLSAGHYPGQNPTTDAHISCEGALLINVGALDGLKTKMQTFYENVIAIQEARPFKDKARPLETLELGTLESFITYMFYCPLLCLLWLVKSPCNRSWGYLSSQQPLAGKSIS